MFMINFTSRRYRTNPFNCVCTWVCNLATKTAYEECIDRVGRGLQLVSASFAHVVCTETWSQRIARQSVRRGRSTTNSERRAS
ncbi:hypothetical protein PI126_g21681 [Phytophthora idaei]|nr:hypothetical protein PI126_g21681 [Phytophthora idaei]